MAKDPEELAMVKKVLFAVLVMANVPPRVIAPDTASLSLPPMFKVPPVRVTAPVTFSVPLPDPAGLIVPELDSVPAFTSIVPVPDSVPLLVKPAALVKLVPDATSIVPDWVTAPVTVVVPLVTLTVPALLKEAIVSTPPIVNVAPEATVTDEES